MSEWGDGLTGYLGMDGELVRRTYRGTNRQTSNYTSDFYNVCADVLQLLNKI